MGTAQKTDTLFWHIAADSVENPFVLWMMDVVDESNPPTAISISYGSHENVRNIIY
jgi:hypothetical protein